MAWIIYVVGPCRVQNELLASFLEAKVGKKCVTKGVIDDVFDSDGFLTRMVKILIYLS